MTLSTAAEIALRAGGSEGREGERQPEHDPLRQ